MRELQRSYKAMRELQRTRIRTRFITVKVPKVKESKTNAFSPKFRARMETDRLKI